MGANHTRKALSGPLTRWGIDLDDGIRKDEGNEENDVCGALVRGVKIHRDLGGGASAGSRFDGGAQEPLSLWHVCSKRGDWRI
mgnify:CR=1 FL=1